MSALVIEQESGTFTKPARRHNGYWAGDFPATATPRLAAGRPESAPTPVWENLRRE